MKGEFYKMDFRAWNTGTVDLSLEEEAAYLRLCHAMYDVGGPVPNSTRFLCAIFRCHHVKAIALVKRLREVGKITLTDEGFLTNRRVTRELQDRDKVRASRKEAGHKGGTSRAQAAAKPLEDNDQPQAFASTPDKQRRGEERRVSSEPKGSGAAPPAPTPSADIVRLDPQRDLFERGKEVLGKSAGGVITSLLRSKGGNIPFTRSVLEIASQKQHPMEYVQGVIRERAPADQEFRHGVQRVAI